MNNSMSSRAACVVKRAPEALQAATLLAFIILAKMPSIPVTTEERYSRQVLFPGIGPEGQRRLGEAKVVVVGCGATGSATASLLARAGVGALRIIDRDYVEPSNLQRQSLFDENDARESLPKAIAA